MLDVKMSAMLGLMTSNFFEGQQPNVIVKTFGHCRKLGRACRGLIVSLSSVIKENMFYINVP